MGLPRPPGGPITIPLVDHGHPTTGPTTFGQWEPLPGPLPDIQLVLAVGAPGPAHILGLGDRDDPAEGPSVSEFDQQFLRSHAMAWSGDHRPH
jgi:hypothetical protein